MYNEGRSIGGFRSDFTEGTVTLLYKKGVRSEVRNYRPITLLNSDYKILTRILAHRSLSLVTQWVSNEQIGFVPFTFIAETTRFIKQLQQYIDDEDTEGLLIFLDMEKAFDRVSWKYLKQALEALGHTTPYMEWIGALYNERRPPKRKIYANGDFSRVYTIHQGTAQGCPLSPLLFLAVMEALTRLIKTDGELRGIPIEGREHFLNMFADDTMLALLGISQIPRLNHIMHIFYLATNMKENMSKREFLGLGNLGNVDPTLVNPVESWEYNEDVKDFIVPNWKRPGEWAISLGAPIGNLCGKFGTFCRGLYTKGKHQLTLAKRVSGRGFSSKHSILNGKYYGKFRYWLWSMLLPMEMDQAIREDAKHFLWLRKPKIESDELGTKGSIGKWVAKDVEYNRVKLGGLGALHWKNHSTAFLINWITRLFHPRKGLWKELVLHWLKPHGKEALLLDLPKTYRKTILRNIPEQYLRTCVESFWKLKIKPHPNHKPESWEEVAAIPILNNGLIKFRVRYFNRVVWSLP